MTQSQIKVGDQVLLIATPSLHTNDEMTTARQELTGTVGPNGTVGFEVFDRIEEAPIKASSYTYVISTQTPNIHPPATLQKLLKILQPGGSLHILEPIIIPSTPSIIGSQLTRTTADLLSALKLSGFIESTVVSETMASDDIVQSHAAVWGIPNSYVPDLKGGKVILTEVVAKKPMYEVGQKFALSFAKKAPTNGSTTAKKSVWTLSLQDNDEDADLMDEDDLLDEIDRIKPSKESLARPDDCEMPAGSRKACKNCSCGRAEQLAADSAVLLDLDDDLTKPEIISVDPNPKKSSCGNCSLGDAFRCSTCPFLGMPSFKPGDEVKLMQNGWGKDDLVGF